MKTSGRLELAEIIGRLRPLSEWSSVADPEQLFPAALPSRTSQLHFPAALPGHTSQQFACPFGPC